MITIEDYIIETVKSDIEKLKLTLKNNDCSVKETNEIGKEEE